VAGSGVGSPLVLDLARLEDDLTFDPVFLFLLVELATFTHPAFSSNRDVDSALQYSS